MPPDGPGPGLRAIPRPGEDEPTSQDLPTLLDHNESEVVDTDRPLEKIPGDELLHPSDILGGQRAPTGFVTLGERDVRDPRVRTVVVDRRSDAGPRLFPDLAVERTKAGAGYDTKVHHRPRIREGRDTSNVGGERCRPPGELR